jgi:hypothetical protein
MQMDKQIHLTIHFIQPPPNNLFSLSILASSAFQNVLYSYFIIFIHLKILVAQAFAVRAGIQTIILACGEDTLASK